MSRAQLTSTVEQNTGGAVAPFVAGKNKIINGDFGVWQRGTSFTNPTSASNTYTSDRWVLGYADANPTSASITQQTFTPGTAPVAGYESAFFGRSTITTVGSTTVYRPFTQRIEDVRVFAGQAATISFWAKADSSRVLTIYWQQNFGTGGSATNGSSSYTANLTTSWQRFSVSFAIPSIAGKTIGTNSYLEIIFQQAAASGSVLDLWGVQVEAGSVATPFTTATGTVQGELAACQRYYQRQTAVNNFEYLSGNGLVIGTSSPTANVQVPIRLEVPMRTAPTSMDYYNLYFYRNTTDSKYSGGTVSLNNQSGTYVGGVSYTHTSAVWNIGESTIILANGVGAYLGFSAEL